MPLVRTEVTDRVAVVTLSDPDRRNALSLALSDQLADAIETLETQDVGAIVITGEGRAFCAGADLGVLQRAEGTELVRIYRGFGRVFQCSIPTIAAVNGAAVGAGFNLALVCDLRLAAESARFDTAFLRLAVHPGGGATWLLRRQLGTQATTALTFCEEVLDGAAAERVGLAWRCVPDVELLPAAIAMAQRAAAHPRTLAQKLRNTIARMETIDDYGPAVQLEMDEQLWSLRQPEAVDAITRVMADIGYEPPPTADLPPTDAFGATLSAAPAGAPPPPDPSAGAPKPGDAGFKLFADD